MFVYGGVTCEEGEGVYAPAPRPRRFCEPALFVSMSISIRRNYTFTVNRQNMIGIFIIPLTLIQLNVFKQNIACNNHMLK